MLYTFLVNMTAKDIKAYTLMIEFVAWTCILHASKGEDWWKKDHLIEVPEVLAKNATLKEWHDQLYVAALAPQPPTEYLLSKISCLYNRGDVSCNCNYNIVIGTCYERHDCCLDVDFLEYPAPPLIYIEFLADRTQQYRKRMTCESLLGETSQAMRSTHRIQNVSMISTCMTTNQKCDISKTDGKIPGFLPVINQDGLIYRNRQCALCNFEKAFEEVIIQYSDCMVDNYYLYINSAQELLDKKGMSCYIHSNQATSCPVETPDLIRGKLENCSDWDYLLCHTYLTFTYDENSKWYANPNCLWCIHGNDSQAMFPADIGELFRNYINNGVQFAPLGMSIIISFTEPRQMALTMKSAHQHVDSLICPPGSDVDLRTLRCKACIGYCGAVDDAIHLKVQSKGVEQQRICFKLRESVIVLFYESSQQSSKGKTSLKNIEAQLNNLGISLKASGSQSNMYTLDGNFTEQILHYLLNSNTIYIPADIKLYILPFGYIPFIPHIFDPARMFNNGKQCAIRKYNTEKIKVVDDCSVSTVSTQSEATYWIEIERNEIKDYSYTCQAFHLHSDCPMKMVETTNYEILPNKSIKLILNGDIIDVEDYIPLSNGIGICNQQRQGWVTMVYDWQIHTTTAEQYVTFTCLCLSIAGSLLTIIIYCIGFSTLSRADKNFVCICVILVFCDTTQLVAAEVDLQSAGCKVIAIILHAGYLALTLWTAVIAINLYQTFGKLSARSVNTGWPVKTAIAVASIDGAVIFACVLVDHVVKDSMMYGTNGLCWIGSSTGRIWSYIAPTIIIYTGSTGLLVYVAYKMKQDIMSGSSKSGNQQQCKTNVSNVVLKIIFILGIPEIIGVIQFTPINELTTAISVAIKLLYVTIRSLHGMSIFLCLVLTSNRFWKTTRALLLKCCSKNLERTTTVSGREGAESIDVTNGPSMLEPTVIVSIEKGNQDK